MASEKRGIIVHYGELALKGNNRAIFEKKLRQNIETTAGGKALSYQGRIFCENTDIEKLRYVFGISWYGNCVKLPKHLNSIINYVLNEIATKFSNVRSFGIFVKRSDKSFQYDSVDIGKIVGNEVKSRYGFDVDLKAPDLPIYIEVADKAFVHFQKIKGLGGLPMGVSGKLLCLLSGGIDSPVAAYQMMRRGCEMDFIHFHSFHSKQQAQQSKIVDFVRILKEYQYNSFIYMVPYSKFQLSLLNNKIINSYELVMFRKFIILLSESLAINNGYMGIVLGDNLGQVASQTVENLYNADYDCKLPVYRPLISFDKDEIIKKSKKIGTYEISIMPYKECCSLVSKSPKTKSKLSTVRYYTDKLDFTQLIIQTLKSVDKLSV